jgi:hypothetical protein
MAQRGLNPLKIATDSSAATLKTIAGQAAKAAISDFDFDALNIVGVPKTAVAPGGTFTVSVEFVGAGPQFDKVKRVKKNHVWTAGPNLQLVSADGPTATFKNVFAGASAQCGAGAQTTSTKVNYIFNDGSFTGGEVDDNDSEEIILSSSAGPKPPTLSVAKVGSSPKPCRGTAPNCAGYPVDIAWNNPSGGSVNLLVNGKVVSTVSGTSGTTTLGAGDVFVSKQAYKIGIQGATTACYAETSLTLPAYPY